MLSCLQIESGVLFFLLVSCLSGGSGSNKFFLDLFLSLHPQRKKKEVCNFVVLDNGKLNCGITNKIVPGYKSYQESSKSGLT